MDIKNKTKVIEELASVYMTIKSCLIEGGYDSEIDWQENIDFEDINEKYFLTTSAWVILLSGMRERVVRDKFDGISAAFFEWESAEKIVCNKEKCFKEAMLCFGHRGKINAIIQVAEHVFEKGFNNVHKGIVDGGIQYLLKLPYIGPITSYHLAKNIGFNVAKPDRHLKRIAKTVGYSSVQLMCEDIAKITGDKIPVIDLVLWRYATLDKNYLGYFKFDE